MNPQVDAYLAEGCGRCALGGTPQCKVQFWVKELSLLREIVLACGLTEERKWSVPCYTFQEGNVILLAAFKEYCSLMFIKGALLGDPAGILQAQTENVQGSRVVKFSSVQEIIALESTLKAYIYEAMEVERAGLKVAYKSTEEFSVPEELTTTLAAMPDLQAAFEALTPGRQRGYLLFFSAPKQSKTRQARIDKAIPAILAGKGLHD